jgi:uncharacterized protein (TIGR02145 family)
MKHLSLTLLFCASIVLSGFSQFIREIKIGAQIWMAENLHVDHFCNGDPIPEAKTVDEWKRLASNRKPAWCYHDNDSSNGVTYGKLYNWYAVNDPRGLAPKGWHIPSDKEWEILTNYLGGNDNAGAKMKSKSVWNRNDNGTNSSGFSGLPGGFIYDSGLFNHLGYAAHWWSSSEFNSDSAWFRFVVFGADHLLRVDGAKGEGLSVRCLRDSFYHNSAVWNQLSSKFISIHDSYSEDAGRYLELQKRLQQLEEHLIAEQKNDVLLGPKGPFETTDQYQKRISDRNIYYDQLLQSQQSALLNEKKELESRYYSTSTIYPLRILLENYNADHSSWKIYITDMGKETSADIVINPADARILWDNRASLKAVRLISIRDTSRILLIIKANGLEESILLLKEFPEGSEVDNQISRLKTGENTGNAIGLDRIYQKVDKDAEFPGGTIGWRRYIEHNLNAQVPIDNGAPKGNYDVIVRFIVSKDGSVSEVKCEKDPGYGMCQEAIRVIKNGPKWMPAFQNGRNVNAYRSQSLTFYVGDE